KDAERRGPQKGAERWRRVQATDRHLRPATRHKMAGMTSTRMACIYCGGHHERSAEVRASWARTTSTATAIPEKRGEPSSAGSPDTPPAPEAEPEGQPQPDRPEPQRAGARPIPVERTTSLTIAGPDTLGRNLVLTAGDPPAPWDVCEVIDIADPDQVEDGVIARLLEAAH